MFQFKKAEKKKSKLRLALCGVSGSGKTTGALHIATGLGGKIAFLDTENGSASLYSDRFEFDVIEMGPPYSPERYIQAIKAAEKEGYEVLIIDSLSHAWSGVGGVLEMHDTVAKVQKNSFTAWRDVTPKHNALIDAMLQSNLHLVATMRSKVAHEASQENGKTKIKKMGLAPVQREGMDYEFTVVFDVDQESHIASASKDRTQLFDGKHFVIDENTGKELSDWLNSGAEPAKKPQMTLISSKETFDLNFWVEKINFASSYDELKGIYKEANGKCTAQQDKNALIDALKARKEILEAMSEDINRIKEEFTNA